MANALALLRTWRCFQASLRRNVRATALIEMALLLPLLLMLLMGSLTYGRYFQLAHDVQRAANDGARAALAGIDSDDRRLIATRAVERNLSQSGNHAGDQTAVVVSETADSVTVTVSVTVPPGSFLTASLVPVPSSVVTADASMELQAE